MVPEDVVNRLSDHLPLAPPQDGEPLAEGGGVDAVLVEREEDERQLGQDGPQTILGGPQRFLGPLLFREVADERGENGRTIRGDPRDRQVDRKLRAVGAHRHDLDPAAQDRLLAGGEVTLHALAVPLAEPLRSSPVTKTNVSV